MRGHAVLAPTSPGRWSTVVNGADISPAVVSADITMRAGEVPTVDLELLVVELGVWESPDALVVIPEVTAEALVALGWTPPQECSPTKG